MKNLVKDAQQSHTSNEVPQKTTSGKQLLQKMAPEKQENNEKLQEPEDRKERSAIPKVSHANQVDSSTPVLQLNDFS